MKKIPKKIIKLQRKKKKLKMNLRKLGRNLLDIRLMKIKNWRMKIIFRGLKRGPDFEFLPEIVKFLP
jgi:hypothetical protein